MNRIEQNYKKIKNTFNISAGYPQLNDTVQIIQDLEKRCRLIEIGLPLATHFADGPTIQESSTAALHNGMTSQLLFDQLNIRESVKSHLLWVFQPMLQYGIEAFVKNVPNRY
jgi:tryptophan synthase alpha chain